MLRQVPGDLVTAHVREFEIHERDRRQELDGESKSSRAGIRDARITISRRFQQRRESIGGRYVVVDYQYARHVAPGGTSALRPQMCSRMRAHDSWLNESSRDVGA